MQNYTENLCIICLSSNEKKTFSSLFNKNATTLSDIGILYETILDKSLIAPNNDNTTKMPKYLCRDCENCVKIFYKFKKKVIESYNKMQKAINKNTNNEDENYIETNISNNCMKIEEVTVIDLNTRTETHKFQIRYLNDNYNDNLPATNEEIEIIEDALNAMDYEEIEIEHMNSDDSNLEYEKNNKTIEQPRIGKTHQGSIICPISTENFQAENPKRSQKTGCLACNKIFNNDEEFADHVREEHQNDKKRIECKMCGKTFNKISLLNKHHKTHYDERPFPCEVCGKRFKTNTHLKYHKYTHMDKQFKCEICLQMYSTPSTLNDHIKFVHKGLKPYSCDICGKKFTKRHKMKDHRMIHFKNHRQTL